MRRGPEWWALGLLLLVGAVALIHATRATTFANDEWTWIFERRGDGLRTWLAPHNVHLSAVPVGIYKLLFATAGLRTYLPYRLVVIAAHLVCVALLFAYARPRVGRVAALAAALLLLTLGPAWEAFLWPFNMTFLLAVDAGVGALLLLERRSRAADLGACALLAVALASAGPGVAFAVGGALEVAGRRRPRDLWIPAVPAALYAAWWLQYQTGDDRISVGSMPAFVLRAAAAATGSVCGLTGADALTGAGHWIRFGLPLLILGLLAGGARLALSGRLPWRVVVLAATALTFWGTVGLGRGALRIGSLVLAATGHEGRYVYIGAVLVLLVAVEVSGTGGRGSRRPPAGRRVQGLATALALAAVLAAAVANLASLRAGAAFERSADGLARAGLGVVEMTRAIVHPHFAPAGFAFGVVTAGPFLAAERALGRGPAASPAEIAADPEATRRVVDGELAAIDGLRLRLPHIRPCRPGRLLVAGGTVSLRAGEVTILPQARSARHAAARIEARRFADTFAPIGVLAPSGAALTPRHDDGGRRWLLRSSAPVRLCG